MKLLFSDKLIGVVSLAENGKMLDGDNEIAKTFSNCFCNIVKDISSENYPSVLMEPSIVSEDTMETAVTKFKNRKSIKLINKTFNNASASFFVNMFH